MDLLQSVIMGVVQGISEFLPISSSGHLVILHSLFGADASTIAFDVFLHIGSLVAVLYYFRHDLLKITMAPFVGDKRNSLILLLLAIATFPAAVAGVLFRTGIETLRSPIVVATTLVAGGIILLVAEKYSNYVQRMRILQNEPQQKKTIQAYLYAGVFQVLALVPGMSRSGVTISGALFAGYNREDAAKVAFLLSIPIIIGAGVWELDALIGLSLSEISLYFSGAVAACISGFMAIAFLMKFVQTRSFTPFVLYRIVLAGAILLFFL
jgi:undecaprenyl-diphosphatase